MICTPVYLHFTAPAASLLANFQKMLKGGVQMSIVADIHMVKITDAKKHAKLSDCWGSRLLFNGHEGTRRSPASSIAEDLSTKLSLCNKQLILVFRLTAANIQPISQPFQKLAEVLKMAVYVW